MHPDAHLHIHTLGFVRLFFLNAPILSFLFPFLSEQDGDNEVASRTNKACRERTSWSSAMCGGCTALIIRDYSHTAGLYGS